MRQFRTLYGTPISNIFEYITDYMSTRKNVEVLIGCDSQSYGKRKTVYGVVIVLYTPTKGGHVLCYKETVAKEKNIPVRLMNEVWRSIEVAEELKNYGIKKAKYIDIDLNPDPRYKSNAVLRDAIGLVEGMGYEVRCKTKEPLVTYAANFLVRN
jgi:predicted RNase H-related nuclease YkuK (DUF458 family)